MYLLMHCCFIFLLSFVPGSHAQSVMVANDTKDAGDDATMMYTLTLAEGQTLSFVAWYKCVDGVINGPVIISNFSGNPEPNGKYSLSSDGLHISDVNDLDEGCYLCRVATLPLGTTSDGFAYLTVNYDPPAVKPFSQCMFKSETSIFKCILPEIVQTTINITWFKDGIVLDVSDTEKYPESNTTLEIRRVYELNGNYQCDVNGQMSDNAGILEVYNLHEGVGIALITLGVFLIIVDGVIFICYICDRCESSVKKSGFKIALVVIVSSGLLLFVVGLSIFLTLCGC